MPDEATEQTGKGRPAAGVGYNSGGRGIAVGQEQETRRSRVTSWGNERKEIGDLYGVGDSG